MLSDLETKLRYEQARREQACEYFKDDPVYRRKVLAQFDFCIRQLKRQIKDEQAHDHHS